MHYCFRSRGKESTASLPIFVCFMTLASAVFPCAAEEGRAVFSRPGTYLSLAPAARYLADETGTWTPEEAARHLESAPLYDKDEEWVELGLHQGVIWLAIAIKNETDFHDLVLEFRNPRMNYVDFYDPDGQGGYTVIHCGVVPPFDVRPFDFPMPAFPFHLQQGESKTVLIRMDNNGDFRQRIWLWDLPSFTNHAATAYTSDILTIGMLIVLVIYQFLVFLALRERSYLYLFLFALSWMFFLMAATGLGKMLIWRDIPWLTLRANSLFLILMAMTFMGFTLRFLESHRITPRLYWATVVWQVVCGIHLVYTSTTDSLLRMQANRVIMLVAMVLAVALAVTALWKGSRGARFFVASWIFLIIGGAILLMMTWYVLPARWVVGSPIVSVLFTASILLWTLELIGRVRVREREQRARLEAQVKERTRALEQALSEVKTLSGLLPICSSCKKIRDDKGYWNSVEHYFSRHTDAGFTHGICPECYDTLYPELSARRRQRELENEA